MEDSNKLPPDQIIMKIQIVLFVIFFVILSGKNYAQEISNIGRIDSLITSAMQGHFDELSYEEYDSLVIDVANLSWENGNYLKILLGNQAAKNSFKVFRNYNSSSSFQGLVLTIDQFSIKIEYSRPYNKAFLGRNYVERRFDIHLKGQFYFLRNDEVLRPINIVSKFSDELLYGNIEDVESSNYNFSKGKREDYTFWEKIYEPVLVIASVGVVVYLFFTQRT